MEILITPVETSIQADFCIIEDFDNLFRLTKYISLLEEVDKISIVGINANRFYERTIKEILTCVKPGQLVGFFIRDNQYLTWFGLKSVIETLFPGQFSLTEQEISGTAHYLCYKRTTEAPKYLTEPNTGWTFGMLTLGKRKSSVEKYIESIYKQKVNNFEILMIVPRKLDWLETYPNVKQIEFSEKDDIGWITRKKNIICENSRFSDILICHDRFYLADTFISDFEKWGYHYSIAVPKVFVPNLGMRGLDWAVVSSENHAWSQGGLLNYRAYSRFAYTPGGATIIRKSAWEKYPWNENLYWNEHEDVEMSRRMQRDGEVIMLADVLVYAEDDRWATQNQVLDYDEDWEVLIEPPVGQNRIRYIPYQGR